LITGFSTHLALQKGLDKGNSLDNGQFRQYNSLGNRQSDNTQVNNSLDVYR
jgi:hypothetical protein